MAQRNSQKRRRDPKSGHLDPYYDRRRKFEAILRPLGLAESFARMPRKVQELFWRFKLPDLALEFRAELVRGTAGRALRKAVETGVRGATVEFDGVTLPIRTFLSVTGGLNLMLNALLAQSDVLPPVKAFVDLALPRIQKCLTDHLNRSLVALHQAVIGPVAAHSRVDGRILTVNLESECNGRGRLETRLVFRSSEAQVRRVSLDGADRPVYRVGRATAGPEVKWIAWPGASIGRKPSECPVFVQSHALRQLAQRVNLPEAAPYLQAWLADSLEYPLIVERRRDGTLLVEYRIQEHRLGYLVAKPVEDMVVVRTFLFLTMAPTPEARQLERRLKLTRRDVEWLGLNDLTAFTKTDLREDEQLTRLLGQCGCGHLLEMKPDDLAASPRPLAAELRQYVGMAA